MHCSRGQAINYLTSARKHSAWIKRFLRSEQASEIAEAALVLPLAFMILLGIYWFGRAFNTYATINHAAREGARVAVAQSCATCTAPNGPPSPTTSIGATVIQALQASSVDPTQVLTYAPTAPYNFCNGLTRASACVPISTGGSGNITFCNQVQLIPSSSVGPPACGVAVSFQYPYRFWLPFTSLNMQTITLTADVQMVGEY
jgi:TadE-like protein